MEHTCSEFLRHGEIIPRPATKITYHIYGSWEKRYSEGSEGESKGKAYMPEKCLKIQTKDNPDTP